MKKIIIMIIPLLLLAAGCSNETPEQPIRNGQLVQQEEVNTIDRETLKSALTTQGYGLFAAFLQSDVRLIRVTYTTEYPKGTDGHGKILFVHNRISLTTTKVIITLTK